MKKLLLLTAIFLFGGFTLRDISTKISSNTLIPSNAPVCQNSFDDMAMLAANHDFQQLHEAPEAYHYDGKGETVTFATPDGKTGQGFFLKAPKKSKKWLFVYQEWWGLNDYIKKESEKFYTDLGDVY